MANIPCLKAENRCFPCAGDSSNPFANLSIEPFDTNIWLSVYFGNPVNVTPNTWTTLACVGFCESSISQIDADDCARRRALECLHDPPLDPIPPEPPPLPPPQVPAICNQEMTCQNGSECYTIPACTIFASSQAEANALAQSLCNERVHDPELSSPCTGGEGGGSGGDEEIPGVLCGAESGSAAPDTLEISSPTNWGSFNYAATGTWPGAASYNVMQLAKDHPPGTYTVEYNSGFRYKNSGIDPLVDCDLLCDPCVGAWQHMEGLWDNSNNIIDGGNYLTNSGVKDIGQPCYNNVGEATPDLGGSNGFQWPSGNDHSNDKSPFYVAQNSGYIINYNSGSQSFFSMTLSSELVFSIIQNAGLIPQPRKVQIRNYSQLAFADPVGASNWNGVFNTRDEYSSMELRWNAPASGLFGGARLSYTMAHPTSGNGKGWQLDIYSAGMILQWRGFKAVGNTSLGRYYRDSTTTPVGPGCVVCQDASADQWFP